MNIPQKDTASNPKQPLFAGIDVGADELVLVIRKNNKSLNPQKFTNTPSDRTRLVNKLAKLSGIIVCLEATGVYHFDLSLALHDASFLDPTKSRCQEPPARADRHSENPQNRAERCQSIAIS
jgi:hypothetical protein